MWCVRKIGSLCTCEHIATYCITLQCTEPHLHACAWRFLCCIQHTHACVWSENSLKTTLCCSREMCCSVLQCVAVCCSVLQCVIVCCSVLQCVAACCSVLQCVAVLFERDVRPRTKTHLAHKRTCEHIAPYCNTQQHTAAHLHACAWRGTCLCVKRTFFKTIVFHSWERHETWLLERLQHTATHCNTLQHTATNCSTLQHLAHTHLALVANLHIHSFAHACFMCVQRSLTNISYMLCVSWRRISILSYSKPRTLSHTHHELSIHLHTHVSCAWSSDECLMNVVISWRRTSIWTYSKPRTLMPTLHELSFYSHTHVSCAWRSNEYLMNVVSWRRISI